MRLVRLMVVLATLAFALAGCGSDSSPPQGLTVSMGTPTATPIDDELPAAQDNGTQGRNPFNNAAHVPPVEACSDALHASDQSLVIRVVPRGPLAPNGSLTFTAGACVYLPPGYVTSGLRYPVLYLLHGGGGDAADWVTFGGIRSIMDGNIRADATNAAIVVMPDGTDAQWYDSIDGTVQNEAYLFDYLIPYVDRHFRTIPEPAGRVVDGLSNGGYGSMLFAAKAPDRFVAAGGMSSNLAGISFTGLGTAAAPAYRHGNLPVDLAGNLDGVDLVLDIGTLCITDQAIDNCLTWQFEQVFVPGNRQFRDAVTTVRANSDGVFDYRETEGGHSWRWWPVWLRDRHLPFLLARLADPRPAATPTAPPTSRPGFRYRSIAPHFSVWGYDVRIDRAVREFVDLSDVRSGGLVVQGSGQATIRTAPLYGPQRSYAVSGTGGPNQHVVADPEGRITFTVDLGPSHEHEQYSTQANMLEAAGGYWTVRTLTIAESP